MFQYLYKLLGGARLGETEADVEKRRKLEDLEAASWYKGVFMPKYRRGPPDEGAARLHASVFERLQDLERSAGLPLGYRNERRGPKLEVMSDAEELRTKQWLMTLEVPGGHMDFRMPIETVMNYETFVAAIQAQVPEFDRAKDLAWGQWRNVREGARNIRFSPEADDSFEFNYADIETGDAEVTLMQIRQWLTQFDKEIEVDLTTKDAIILYFSIRLGERKENIEYDGRMTMTYVEKGERSYIRVQVDMKEVARRKDGEILRLADEEPLPDNSVASQAILHEIIDLFDKTPKAELLPADFGEWDALRQMAMRALLDKDPANINVNRRNANLYRQYNKTHRVPMEWKTRR